MFLYGIGNRIAGNCRQVPITAEIIRRMPKIHTAWISILSPRYHIPAHSGVTKGILRANLGLLVPREREKCRIRIGDESSYWAPGKSIDRKSVVSGKSVSLSVDIGGRRI